MRNDLYSDTEFFVSVRRPYVILCHYYVTVVQ